MRVRLILAMTNINGWIGMKKGFLALSLLGLFVVTTVFTLYFLGSTENSEAAERDFSLKPNINGSALPPDDPFQGGEMVYLHDDFSNYQDYSLSIDSFEANINLKLNGREISTAKSKDDYGGEWSVEFEVAPENAKDGTLRLQREITTMDLSRWNQAGVFSAWIRLENPSGVSGISLRLVDSKGNVRLLRRLENYLGTEENQIKQDDPHKDYYLPEEISNNEWEDYMFSEGWNYLFWPSHEFNESPEFDIGQVSGYEILIYTNSDFRKQMVRFDNLRVSDGLQKERNPTNGAWFAPGGMPQYGVWDIDDGKIRLMNVRQTQYPSNGDHTRLISRQNVPDNFRLRMQFRLVNVPESNWLQQHSRRIIKNPHKNTWIRVAYDFEHEYDAGHDWFGTFLSLEYNKYGLVTVSPIERFFEQAEEPSGHSYTKKNRTDFRPTEDQLYLLDLTVQGQHSASSLYVVKNGGRIQEIGRVEHTFERQRPEKRLPLSIEATGNAHLEIYQIELLSLEVPSTVQELEAEGNSPFGLLSRILSPRP